MSGRSIFLHFGHLGNTDAAFFLATLVYIPFGAAVLVATLDAEASNGVRIAQRFMGHYHRAGAAVKAAAFLLVVSSSMDLGFVPGHVRTDPVAAALFSLDAAVLIGSSVLAIVLPALRPAALILLVAGALAYLLGGVQLDGTALIAKGLEGVAVVLLLIAVLRAPGEPEAEGAAPEAEGAAPQPAADLEARPAHGHGARGTGRSRRGGRRSRRRPARRTDA